MDEFIVIDILFTLLILSYVITTLSIIYTIYVGIGDLYE